jgi:ABC-type nitrate/sulfonate/bicarbonate transport system substrate-binding protein
MGATRLRLSTFRGMQNLPVYVAEREGLFVRRGLAVDVTYTVGSAAQISALAGGDCDLAQTAPDNVINADDDPAGFGLDRARTPRLVMLMGGSVGALGLFARRGTAAISALRGTILGVDNPRSGFALVLRDMMAGHNLLLDRDYRLISVGGTSERLQALRGDAVAATILYTPFDALAEAESSPRLAGSEQQYAAYASLATAATAPWVADHKPEASYYIAAIREALGLIHAPDYRTRAQSIIREQLHLDDITAQRAYAAFTDRRIGFGVEAKLDKSGLQTVIALRETYGMPRSTLKDLAAYLEPGPYQEAGRLLT